MAVFTFRDIAAPPGPYGPPEFTIDLERVAGAPHVTPAAGPGYVAITVEYNDGKSSDRLQGTEAEAKRFVEALTAFRAGSM